MKQPSQQAKITLANILRGSLMLAVAVAVIGTVLFLWQYPSHEYDYRVFKGEPLDLTQIREIWQAALNLNSPSILQIGILLLIFTPILRVFTCLLLFLWQRDYLYIGLATFVLAVLIHSFVQ